MPWARVSAFTCLQSKQKYWSMVLVTQQEVRKIRVCSTETGVCAEMSRKRRYYCSVMKLDLTGLSQRDYMGDRGILKEPIVAVQTPNIINSLRGHITFCVFQDFHGLKWFLSHSIDQPLIYSQSQRTWWLLLSPDSASPRGTNTRQRPLQVSCRDKSLDSNQHFQQSGQGGGGRRWWTKTSPEAVLHTHPEESTGQRLFEIPQGPGFCGSAFFDRYRQEGAHRDVKEAGEVRKKIRVCPLTALKSQIENPFWGSLWYVVSD